MKLTKQWTVMLAAGFVAWAGGVPATAYETETVDGVAWKYTVLNGKAFVGGGTASSPAVPTTTSGAIAIPATLGGLPVTGIRSNAFLNCANLTSVAIPDGVTIIGMHAFENCTGLWSVAIGNGVKDIREWAFQGCRSLESVDIPDSVTNIAERAFGGCWGLESVDFGNGLACIGGLAFVGCTALSGVTIPDSVTSIGIGAFAGCSALKSVGIPDSVTNIGYSAFEGCEKLRSVAIPASVTHIGPGAFGACDELTDISVADGNPVYASHQGVLLSKDHTSLVQFPGGKTNTYAVPDTVTNIMAEAFAYCDKLRALAISGRVTDIGENAFRYCTGLTNVVLGEGVERIWRSAFAHCSGLRDLTIPASVNSLGKEAFYGCNGLESVAILGNATNAAVASLSSGAPSPFYNCSLHTVVFGDKVTRIGAYMFRECEELTRVEIPGSVTNIGYRAFDACRQLTAVHIHDLDAWCGISFVWGSSFTANPLYCAHHLYLDGEEVVHLNVSGANRVKDHAFSGCNGLEDVVLGGSVGSIGTGAFSNCTGLASATIPGSVTNIGTNAFSGCINLTAVHVGDLAAWCGISFGNARANPLHWAKHLYVDGAETTELVIPDGVKKLKFGVFYGCSGLTSVTLPNSVTSIGKSAFCQCSGLETVSLSDRLTSIGAYAFGGCQELRNIRLPTGVTNIGACAFSNCTALAELVVPDGVAGLGNNAFSGCTALARLEVPGAWEGTDMLDGAGVPEGCEVVYRSEGGGEGGGGDDADATETIAGVEWRYEVSYEGNAIVKGAEPADGALAIPAMLGGHPVTGIGDSAFEDCERLTSVVIQDGVAWLGYGAFCGCVRLESASIPSSLAEIGQYAFENCGRLASLELSEGVERIGDGAFAGCSGLTDVSIPDSVASIGDGAFMECDGIRDTVSITGIVLVDGWVVGYDYDMLPDNLDLSGVRGLADDGLAWAGLRSVILPEDLRAIGAGAFHGCYSLESVSIPDSVVRIGDSAFSSCSALAGIKVGAGNTAFSSMDGVLFDKEGKTLLCCPGGKSGTYVLPAGVEEIAWSAFDGCSGLTGLVLPDSLENLDGSGVFYTCGALETLEAPISWKEKHFDYYGESLFWTEYAEVPERCTVTYRDAPAQTETEDSPVPIPFAWLETEAADILAAAGGDHEAAALAPAANGLPVWQCYVAGLSTTEPEAEFKVKSVSFADGEVQIGWSPDLNENGTKTNRTYTVEGKPALTDDWGPCAPSSRFFRVRVELPPQ